MTPDHDLRPDVVRRGPEPLRGAVHLSSRSASGARRPGFSAAGLPSPGLALCGSVPRLATTVRPRRSGTQGQFRCICRKEREVRVAAGRRYVRSSMTRTTGSRALLALLLLGQFLVILDVSVV